MSMRDKRFEIDRANGKVLGVCAGIADYTGLDVTIVRIGLVVMTIFGGFPWTLIAYGIAYAVGQREKQPRHPSTRPAGGEDARERMRDLDRRMQEIETYVAGSNSRLAREIEELR